MVTAIQNEGRSGIRYDKVAYTNAKKARGRETHRNRELESKIQVGES